MSANTMCNTKCVYDAVTKTTIMVELTASELSEAQAHIEAMERNYWLSIDYGDAINTRIRERYSESQEFAILRQKDDKPEEYAEYYAYCEECKAYVKQMKGKYEGEV